MHASFHFDIFFFKIGEYIPYNVVCQFLWEENKSVKSKIIRNYQIYIHKAYRELMLAVTGKKKESIVYKKIE